MIHASPFTPIAPLINHSLYLPLDNVATFSFKRGIKHETTFTLTSKPRDRGHSFSLTWQMVLGDMLNLEELIERVRM